LSGNLSDNISEQFEKLMGWARMCEKSDGPPVIAIAELISGGAS
jgi:hypothetical protein